MTKQAQPDGEGRWQLVLRPAPDPAGTAGGLAGTSPTGGTGGTGPAGGTGTAGDARTPYAGRSPHTGRIVIGNPQAAPVLAAGVDLLDVRRFELAARRCGDWLERRLLSGDERAALAADPAHRLHQLGCLFGVKESVLKALGGIPRGGRYPHIELPPPRPGHVAPVRLRGELARCAGQQGARLVAGALPVGDGLVLSWALALGPTRPAGATTSRKEAA